MTRTLAVLALAVAGAGVLSAGSSSAQMAVSVTVVRSCLVDARLEQVRFTCTGGAQSTVTVSDVMQQPSAAVTSDDHTRVLTLNF